MNSAQLFQLANLLTYKILLAFFPFLIFLITILGAIQTDLTPLAARLSGIVTAPVLQLVEAQIGRITSRPNPGLMSISFATGLFSASGGFKAVMHGVNATHHQLDRRGFVKRSLIAICLALLFVFAILSALVAVMLENLYMPALKAYAAGRPIIMAAANLGITAGLFFLLVLSTMAIYKFSLAKKVPFSRTFPGAFAAVLLWILVSKGFDIYITRFSNFSSVYGSIANIFVLILWLNLISQILLTGSLINAGLAIKNEPKSKS